MKHIFVALAGGMLPLAACVDSGTEPDAAPMPVIEGWIDSGGHPTVLFTSAITPDADGGSLMDKMVRWGMVTISDGENELVMTGATSSNFFPPYRYYTLDMTGIPGRTYTITARYKDFHATATCRMFEPTKINDITFSPAADSDTLRSATLHFTAPADVPAYYYVTIKNVADDAVGLPALLGCKEAVEAGAEMTIPIFNSKQTHTGEPFTAQLRVGQRCVVSLHRVPRQVYEFWRAYDDAVMFGDNMLIGSSGSLPSTVEGGLGVFSARGTDSKFIIVE